MKQIILFVLLFYLTPVYSQKLEWFPIGARWEYDVGFLSGVGKCYNTIVSDTILLGLKCKILQGTCFGDTKDVIRESNGKVYVYKQGLFNLLYDFNVESGDTLYQPGASAISPINCELFPGKQIANLILQSHFLNIGLPGQNIRYYVVDRTLNSNLCPAQRLAYNVEPFGNLYGYFFPIRELAEIIFDLKRYSDSCWDISPKIIYGNGRNDYKVELKINRSCFSVSTHDTKTLSNISIFPNPARDQITIDLEDGRIQDIEVWNINGRSMMRVSGTKSGRQNIDLCALSVGMYIIKVKDRSGMIGVQKVSIVR